MHRCAVDVGGTFIDFVLLDEETRRARGREAAGPPRDARGRVPRRAGAAAVGLSDARALFHGTTVGINTVLQERGARVGLDHHGRLPRRPRDRPRLEARAVQRPLPAAGAARPRYLRREVPERIAGDGSVLVPLDLEALDREVDLLVERGRRGGRDLLPARIPRPAARAAAAARVRRASSRARGHRVARGGDGVARVRAHLDGRPERVRPAAHGPIPRRARGSGCATAGFQRPLALMQSNGGVISAERAAERPIRTLESGPAGGVIGCARARARARLRERHLRGRRRHVVRRRLDRRTAGSSRRPRPRSARRPVVGPVIDIVSIGAGGGSIAWIDELGAVAGGAAVGGRVTRARVLRARRHGADGHRLPSDARPAGSGELPRRPDAASTSPRPSEALQSRIAGPLGLDLDEAAAGVLAIAETNMVFAIRAVTVERGLDPREFVVFSYGGGGGLFAAAVAEELEVPDGGRPAGAGELLGLGHPHLRLSRGRRRDAGAAAGRILGRRSSRRGPAAARGGGRSEPRALRVRRGRDRAALSRRYPLRRTGPRDHRPARARVARRPSGAARRGAANASPPRTCSCTGTARSTRRSSS